MKRIKLSNHIKFLLTVVIALLSLTTAVNVTHADDTQDKSIVYHNVHVYSVDNERESIKVKSNKQGAEPETIYNVPFSVRKDMMDISQSKREDIRNTSFDISVTDTNTFEDIDYDEDTDGASDNSNVANMIAIGLVGVAFVIICVILSIVVKIDRRSQKK